MLLLSFGGQQSFYYMLGKVPPNFTYTCEGWQCSNKPVGNSQSQRFIFWTVSSGKKFLTIPQIMRTEVLILTLQTRKSLDLQASARKEKDTFILSAMEKRPRYPESTRKIQFSTCPGMKNSLMMQSRRQICKSQFYLSLMSLNSLINFQLLNIIMGRQWLSRPQMQMTPLFYFRYKVPACSATQSLDYSKRSHTLSVEMQCTGPYPTGFSRY